MVAAIVGDDGAVERVVGPDGGRDAGTSPPATHAPARTTTPGSSSPRARPGRPRASRSPTGRRRVRRRRGAAVPASRSRSARATGCSPGCRSRSTPRARRCGWPGATAPAWCRPRARWCAPAWTSARGWSRSGITVVSTVPTLAALWPAEALDEVRLLIFGGEACPPELARAARRRRARGLEHVRPDRGDRRRLRGAARRRRARAHRAAARRLGPRRRRPDGQRRSTAGETGELIIGGVGLARYLDPAKDAEKFAPMPTLGWERAYRSGDLVVRDARGARLRRPGRRPGQGRRPAHRAGRGRRRPAGAARGRAAAAAAVQTTPAGTPGPRRLRRAGPVPDARPRRRRARRGSARARCPPRWCPLLAVVDDIPTRTSGKVDRDALPWPLPSAATPSTGDATPSSTGPRRGSAEQWASVLGVAVAGAERRLLRVGGGSLAAAQLVSRLRAATPDGHGRRRLRAPARSGPWPSLPRRGRSTPATSRPSAVDAGAAARAAPQLQACSSSHAGVPPLVGPAVARLAGRPRQRLRRARTGARGSCTRSRGGGSAVGWLVLISPSAAWPSPPPAPGCCCAASRPGTTRAAGACTCGSGLAEASWARAAALANLAGAPWIASYARALGAQGRPRRRPAQRCPPVTGLLTLGDGCAVEPEVDLSRALAGRRRRCTSGAIRIGAGATVGSRSTLLPGARIGQGRRGRAGLRGRPARSPPGELLGRVAGGAAAAAAQRPWPRRPAAARGGSWARLYGSTAAVLAACPLVAAAARLLVRAGPSLPGRERHVRRPGRAAILWSVPLATVVASVVYAADRRRRACGSLGLGLARGLPPGAQPGRAGRCGRPSGCMDPRAPCCSRSTPAWSRRCGCGRSAPRSGTDVEASTVLLLPTMTTVARRRVPRRRHDGRLLRAGRRLDAHRDGARSASAPSSATRG